MRESAQAYEAATGALGCDPPTARVEVSIETADPLLARIRLLLEATVEARTDIDVARALNLSRKQAKALLDRLAKDHMVEKLSRPVRYRAAAGRLL
jgi:predicted ArsR family transcriptional regulator